MNRNQTIRSLFAVLTLVTLSRASLPAQQWPPRQGHPAQPAFCQPGIVEFFAGNHGHGRSLGGHLATPGIKAVQNDEVRSLVLRGVAPGTVIRLFDDDHGRTGDDWVEIRVRQYHPQLVIDTLERCRDDPFVQVIYHRVRGDGNLDGKVSYVVVSRG